MSSHDLPLDLSLRRHVLSLRGAQQRKKKRRECVLNKSILLISPLSLRGRQTPPGGGSAAVGQKKKNKTLSSVFMEMAETQFLAALWPGERRERQRKEE